MSATKAFDLALFVPAPANPQDGVVIDTLGPPFTTKFAPLVVGAKSGIKVSADLPAANAPNQILVSGAGPGHAWGLATNPDAAASVPPPTARFQLMMANDVPAWQTTTIAVVLSLGGAVTQASGGVFEVNANLAFTPSATPTRRIDGGDPNVSILDNFSWDAGEF